MFDKQASHIPEINQGRKIQRQLHYLKNNSPYYQGLFKKHGIDVSQIDSESFSKIPITQKEDLQNFNVDFICVPKSEIIDYVTTSGTLGKPVTFALNEHDLERLAYNEQRSFKCAGVTKNDTVQITTTLDRRFMAGLAYFLGLRKLGAGVVRVGSGALGLQWDSIFRFKPTYLVAVPSFLLKLATYAEENGIDIKKSSVKAAVCIGEPLRNDDFQLNVLGEKIKKKWNIELFSTYASTEMSTAFTECPQHCGGHVPQDMIYPEIVDETGNLVKPGEVGELVVTTLGVKTMPLLRYATGDMVRMYADSCPCGKKSPRLSPVLGRKKQQIKLKGTTIYPQHIKDILADFEGLENYIIEVSTNSLETDSLNIKISDKTSLKIQQTLREKFRAKLRVLPTIICLPEQELLGLKFPESSRKPVVFVDKRQK